MGVVSPHIQVKQNKTSQGGVACQPVLHVSQSVALAGEDNRTVARKAVVLAGLGVSVPRTTINRLSGSSMDA